MDDTLLKTLLEGLIGWELSIWNPCIIYILYLYKVLKIIRV
jgi:hypothetical protein